MEGDHGAYLWDAAADESEWPSLSFDGIAEGDCVKRRLRFGCCRSTDGGGRVSISSGLRFGRWGWRHARGAGRDIGTSDDGPHGSWDLYADECYLCTWAIRSQS